MVECSVDTEKSYSQAEKQTMGGILHISVQITPAKFSPDSLDFPGLSQVSRVLR